MLREITKRQHEWLDKAVALRENVLAPNASEIDEFGRWPKENFDALKASGLWGIGVPEEFGGAGVDPLGIGLVLEQLARGCGSTAMAFGMHVNSFWPLAAVGTKEQNEKYIVPAMEKKLQATHANTERATGTQFWNFLSFAQKTKSGWLLNAEKAFVTSAGEADVYWFTGRPSEDAPLMAVNLWYLDASLGGWDITDEWHGLGLRGQRSARMVFKDIEVPDDAAFVADGSMLETAFPAILASLGATLIVNFLGMSQSLVDHTIKHVKNRVHQNTGLRLSQVDMVQDRIGAMQARVDATRELVYSALDLAGRESLESWMVPMIEAKSAVASTATYVAEQALHACGAQAYRGDGEVSRAYRDAIAAPIMAPSEDWCNILVGRALLDEPLFG
ncbi:MAG: acyl-CoA dehydrogenase family protein [Actinomycetota bacterium]|nr:acyl-CoA/acyl-ACP dehydrogenase [Actinomycetota bacterium]